MKTLKLLSFLLFLSFNSAFSQYIITSDTSGCAPLADVNFSIDGSLTDVFWDFGDGTSSPLETSDHSFGEPGEYTVRLTGDDAGTPVDETVVITVYGKPSPNFSTPDPTEGCVPFDVSFIDNSSSLGGIETWEWTFGDGGSDSTQNPTYTYTIAGEFTVSLIVTDSNGCDSALVIPQMITANNTPEAIINSTGVTRAACTPPLAVDLGNSTENLPEYTYSWDFGNGASSSQRDPSVQNYTTEGNFTITLTVTDDVGCSDDAITTVAIGNPTASFTTADTVCFGFDAIFTNTSLGANSYEWDFGNTNTGVTEDVQHRYAAPGDYNVTLVAKNTTQGCQDDTTITIHIQQVIAEFTSSPIFSCENPMCQTFNETSSDNATTFNWLFIHDGAADNGENVTHCSYIDTNRYTVHDPYTLRTHLTAISHFGCRDTISHPSTLSPISAFVQPDVYQGCAPLTVEFSDSTRSNDVITSWLYDFGDGSTSTDRNPTHVFADTGTYVVTVDVEEVTGCRDDDYTLIIEVGEPYTPSFTVSTAQVCKGEDVTFESTTPDPDNVIDYYNFSSDNGMFSECPQDSIHTGAFTQIGTHNVTLTTSHNGCEATTTINDAVEVLGPAGHLTYDFNCATPFDYSFTGSVQNADQWRFNIDGADLPINADLTKTYTFPATGDYWAVFEAENTGNGCPSEIDSVLINVREIQADIFSDDTTACFDVDYTFDASGSQDVYTGCTNRYIWISDNNPPVFYSTNSSFTYEPESTGPNNIQLIVSDVNGCRDTANHDFIVYETEAVIGVDTMQGCLPLTISFEDNSTSTADIAEWAWSFDNGETAISQDTTVTFTDLTTTEYTVELIVTNEFGCFDETEITISPIIPRADFRAETDRSVCREDSIGFRINYSGPLQTWELNYGDGITANTSSETVMYHVYDTAGYFDVTLTVLDTNGCDASYTRSNYAFLQDYPTAMVTADVDVDGFICYPAAISFIDESIFSPADSTFPFFSREWNLGTGSSILPIENVSTIYEFPGNYDATLMVSTQNGCADTAIIDLNIVGPIADFTVNPDVVCIGEEINFQIIDSSDVSFFSWDFGNGTILNGEVGQTTASYDFVPLGGETMAQLLLWGQDSVCPMSVGKTIEVHNVEANFGSIDSLICVGNTIAFVDSSISADTYSWEFGNGETSSTNTPPNQLYDVPGTYDVTLTITNNASGCVDEITRTYIAYDLPNIIVSDTIGCQGDEIILTASGAVDYTWTPNDDIIEGDDSPSATILLSNTDSITIEGIDENGCINFANTFITVFGPVSGDDKDTCIIIGEEVEIGRAYGDAYSHWWADGDTTYLECLDCPTQTIMPLQETVYTLSVEDSLGCYNTQIIYDICVDPEFNVDIPDLFTPNGDGVNDLIMIDGWGIKNLLEFKIYNRWGELVFETTDINTGWDGTYKGKLQNVDVFIYVVTVEYYENGGTGTKTGNITLMR